MNRWDLLFAAGTLTTVFLPILIVFIGSGKRMKALQERQRARRLHDARMNAILLRLDI